MSSLPLKLLSNTPGKPPCSMINTNIVSAQSWRYAELWFCPRKKVYQSKNFARKYARLLAHMSSFLAIHLYFSLYPWSRYSVFRLAQLITGLSGPTLAPCSVIAIRRHLTWVKIPPCRVCYKQDSPNCNLFQGHTYFLASRPRSIWKCWVSC
jgi:hypothetical protein